jgi:hypothetical protein
LARPGGALVSACGRGVAPSLSGFDAVERARSEQTVCQSTSRFDSASSLILRQENRRRPLAMLLPRMMTPPTDAPHTHARGAVAPHASRRGSPRALDRGKVDPGGVARGRAGLGTRDPPRATSPPLHPSSVGDAF